MTFCLEKTFSVFWVLLAFVLLPQLAVARSGLVEETYSNEAGSGKFSVFVPENLKQDSGLLVVLHGCFMTGQQMMSGTLLNQKAAEKNFVVIYPEQTYQNNIWKCWNWFLPENQSRDTGEASLIVGMANATVQKYDLNPRKVYLTGLSAGGAMAANLLGCYSDFFAGGLLHSGVEFAAARSESEAHQVLKNGPNRDVRDVAGQAFKCSTNRKSLLKVIVVHGTNDPHVTSLNADRTFEVFKHLNTIQFLANGGTQDQIKKIQTVLPGTQGQYSSEVTEALFKGQSLVKKVIVDHMGHGWSGGQMTTPYMEPKGIDASEMIANEFFR